MYGISGSLRNMIDCPCLPALAVLPILWTNESLFCGGSYWIIQSTSGMSMPLAERSVVNNIKWFFLPYVSVEASLNCL